MAIVGGGIAGLATAFALQEEAERAEFPVSITVLEAGPAWGGKISTRRTGDLVIERGPDSFLSQKPAALELCAKLGLSDRLINTNRLPQGACVYSRGRLRELPEGLVLFVPSKLGPFLRSGLVSLPGILRMGLDLVLPQERSKGDESVASFFRRRLGAEAFERLIEPLMAGIYAGDAEQMSLRATFPRFLELERKHGSVIRGMLAGRHKAGGTSRPGPARSMFVTLENGLSELIEALVARIEKRGASLALGRTVAALRAPSVRSKVWTYDLVLDDGGVVTADAVVLATPAYVAARLIRPHSRPAAEKLDAIPYASTATVSLGYRRQDLGPAVRGFGFIVPRAEGRDLVAATWTSLKWPHRTPAGQTLLRCYVGGVGREAVLAEDDAGLLRRVLKDLREIAQIAAEPDVVEVARWDQGMPQYTIGHPSRLEAIQVALNPYHGLYLTGSAYRGVGIPDCIKDASDTAALLFKELTERRS